MDPYYTITGPRPDLAAVEVNPPEGYIGSKVVPVVSVADKTGTIYYNDVTADVAAQTGRSTVTAPNSTTIAGTSTTFTCAEAISRGKIAPDEVKAFGGIAKADMIGVKFAKRNVLNAVEAAVAAVTTGSTADDTWDAAKFLQDSQTALDAVRLYYGKTTLLASTIVLKRMVEQLLQDDTYGPVLGRIVSGTSPSVAVQGVQFSAWLNALSMFIGVDQVLAGDDTIWNAGDNAGKFVIGKFDDGSQELIHKYEPVFARNFMFLPEGGNPWFVESIGDRLTKANVYDAALWYNVVTLNAGAIYVFEGVAA